METRPLSCGKVISEESTAFFKEWERGQGDALMPMLFSRANMDGNRGKIARW